MSRWEYKSKCACAHMNILKWAPMPSPNWAWRWSWFCWRPSGNLGRCCYHHELLTCSSDVVEASIKRQTGQGQGSRLSREKGMERKKKKQITLFNGKYLRSRTILRYRQGGGGITIKTKFVLMTTKCMWLNVTSWIRLRQMQLSANDV